MHYWFIAAAFFAFTCCWLIWPITSPCTWRFGTAALVSMALVVSYLRLVNRMREALLVAGSRPGNLPRALQLRVLLRGLTVLAITVGAIVTLFVLMQMTARVSWDDVFAGGAHANTAFSVRRSVPMPVAPSAPIASGRSSVHYLVFRRNAPPG